MESLEQCLRNFIKSGFKVFLKKSMNQILPEIFERMPCVFLFLKSTLEKLLDESLLEFLNFRCHRYVSEEILREIIQGIRGIISDGTAEDISERILS